MRNLPTTYTRYYSSETTPVITRGDPLLIFSSVLVYVCAAAPHSTGSVPHSITQKLMLKVNEATVHHKRGIEETKNTSGSSTSYVRTYLVCEIVTIITISNTSLGIRITMSHPNHLELECASKRVGINIVDVGYFLR